MILRRHGGLLQKIGCVIAILFLQRKWLRKSNSFPEILQTLKNCTKSSLGKIQLAADYFTEVLATSRQSGDFASRQAMIKGGRLFFRERLSARKRRFNLRRNNRRFSTA